MAAEPSVSFLGTTTKFASALGLSEAERSRKRTALLSRYALQNSARTLLPKERVSSCLRLILPNLSHVEIWGNVERHIAHYRNLALCASVWTCPVCAPVIADRRRDDLEAAIRAATARGWSVMLETLTAPHSSRSVLRPLLGELLDARRRFVSGRLRDDASKRYLLRGRVTSLEVTHGVNGFHPHFHSLLFFEAGADLRGYEARMADAWLAILRFRGMEGNQHAYKLQRTFGAVSDYVAKWGHEPALERPWGVASELTRWHVKLGRVGAHMTPFQLLALSDTVAEAGPLFCEYAAAFKGRHQLQWSRGLRADLLGDEDEVPDEEAAKGQADDLRQFLASLTYDEWRVVRANGARAEALNAALDGSVAFAEFKRLLGC